AENFAGDITLRVPTVVTKAERHRAGLILTKEFNPAFLQFLGPRVIDSLVSGKITRSRNDQTRACSSKEAVRARLSGMMLSFDDDVAARVGIARQQCLFRLDATVGHEQDRRRWLDEHADDIGLIIGDRRAEDSRRKQDLGRDIARKMENVSRAKSIWFDSA